LTIVPDIKLQQEVNGIVYTKRIISTT